MAEKVMGHRIAYKVLSTPHDPKKYWNSRFGRLQGATCATPERALQRFGEDYYTKHQLGYCTVEAVPFFKIGKKLVAVGRDWNPLASDADSCMVLDRLAELDLQPRLSYRGCSEWFVHLEDDNGAYGGRNECRRVAIVDASIRAFGGEL